MGDIEVTPEEDEAFRALTGEPVRGAASAGGEATAAADVPLGPVPIRREHAEELFVQWQQFRDRRMKEWIDRGSPATAEELRAMLVDSFFDLLDRGEIIALTHQEHSALSDEIDTLVSEVLQGERKASPELKAALAKLAFSFGRQYGLTEFDMGMEPITDA